MNKGLFHIVNLKLLYTFLAFVFLFSFSKSDAQVLLQWNTFGNVGTETTEPSVFNNANISSANLTFGAGITAAANANRFGGSGWFDVGNTAAGNTISEAVAGNNYIQFIVTPSAGCSVTPTSLVFSWDKSGTGPQNVVLRSSVDGYTSDIGTVAPTAAIGTNNTINITGISNISTPITFRLYGYGATATGGTGGFDIGVNTVNVQLNGSTACSACTEPTTAVTLPVESQIACNGFNLSWTNGNGTNRLVVVSTAPITGNPVDGVNYTANSTYGSGGTIGANQYVIYNGTSNTDYVIGLAANTTYYYKIFEFNDCSGSPNYLTSGTVASGDVTTTNCSSAAGITAVYIDACAGGCGYEGNNELIWGTTGSYAMNVSNNGPTLHYSSSPTPTVTFISTYATNAANITALNTAVGACGTTTFVDPNTLGYIPPNSNFVIANNCMCSPAAYDFSGLCGSGPIYVVFGTNASWPCNTTGGIFGNYSAGGGVRYFDLNFSAWGVSTSPIYNYTIGSLSNGGDGDATLYSPSGGAATTYTNTTCTVPLLLLPIDLLDFYATKNGKINEVVWKVASEENVMYYDLEKSRDGFTFETYASVNINEAPSNVKMYSVIDDSPYNDITYYRLSTKESDGRAHQYKIISVEGKSIKWDYSYYQQEQNLIVEFKNTVPKNSTIGLYDLTGKLLVEQTIESSQTILNTGDFSSGIYFVKIESPYKTENFKVVLHN